MVQVYFREQVGWYDDARYRGIVSFVSCLVAFFSLLCVWRSPLKTRTDMDWPIVLQVLVKS